MTLQNLVLSACRKALQYLDNSFISVPFLNSGSTKSYSNNVVIDRLGSERLSAFARHVYSFYISLLPPTSPYSMRLPTETEILQSWENNAPNWKKLIEEDRIESRRLVTNDAIIQVLSKLAIESLLDLGCGEGWLVRHMKRKGVASWGLDGSASLIRMAKAKGEGHYACVSYSDIIEGYSLEDSPFEGIVLNFSLYDKLSTPPLLDALKQHLTTNGKLVIQTLHPNAIHAFEPSHWKPNVWEGLPGKFRDAHPWYHRSMGDWKLLFGHCGYKVLETYEPENPRTQKPSSIIFVLAPHQQ